MTPGVALAQYLRAALMATILSVSAMTPASGQPAADAGLPVLDPIVRAKCSGTCHVPDDSGRLPRISWARTTPEGWQASVQRMVRDHDVALTPPDARAIVKYLSSQHGLAPEEARPVLYAAERRVRDEEALNPALFDACAGCHAVGVALSWRRPATEWRRFVEAHATRYRFKPEAEAIAELVRLAPFTSPEWTAYSTRRAAPAASGRWLVTAHVQGRGPFVGEMIVEPGDPGRPAGDEFVTRVRLRSISDGTELSRSGRSVLYGGTAWRGRSQGTGSRAAAAGAPGELASEARESMLMSADGGRLEGRWFWGQYDEFGIDVTAHRATGPAVLLADPPAIRAGASNVRVRLLGDGLPTAVTAAEVSAGAGVTVRRVLSAAAGLLVIDVDVDAAAAPGSRRVTVGGTAGQAELEGGLTVYDRVDYVKVTPESSVASFASADYAAGYQQFEAIGYQRGPDGKARTGDDLPLGPVPVRWSMDVFYETDPSRQARVGRIDADGLFTPAVVSPNTNFDVSIVATATTERAADGKPLVGKGYLVVTVPTYTFEGRTFVRELNRWIEVSGR